MSTLPLEIAPLLSFFQVRIPSDLNQPRFLETTARIHTSILLGLEQLPDCEDPEFEDNPAKAYWNALLGPGAQKENLSIQLISDFIQSTLETGCRFTLEGSHVFLHQRSRSIDLFPFCILRQQRIFCFTRMISGGIVYSDADGNRLAFDARNASFEEIIDALMEKKYFRLVLKALEKNSDLRKALENKKYTAHCYLACDYYKARRYQDAIAEFQRAMKIKANMPQLFYNLALSHARVKAYSEAIRLLNQLNRIKPDQAKTYELLGDFYLQTGDWERSLNHYQRAQELSENKSAIEIKIKKLEEKYAKERLKEKEEEKDDKFYVQKALQDLTLQAELGQALPVIGRESEILQMQEILACHSKKNVLILGEPGVGKTALVEELAYRMIAGKVSPRLQNKKLIRINMGSLLAGAKFRGQFEERLLNVIKEIKKLNCILFIDDIHQISSGSTGKTNSMEAAQYLKPALLNNELQIIGATSFDEFRNTIEKDSSFLRCFQIVKLEEPDSDALLKILQSYRSTLENYHNVAIQEDSLETISMWVKVLLRDRALPDKALDILDRAAARVSIQEKSSVVSAETVLQTLSEVSRVPLSRMSISETVHYKNIENFLSRRVIGQLPAIQTVSKVLCTAKLRMTLNANRPKGIFLFVGPTGVGKTELARSMAEFLFGADDKIIRIDMSEYMESYSASRLIGTSPGYVGYYDQNQLVDKIRSNPYSLILLDEIEKADPQLLNLFLQVFDAGRLTDGKGKVAYFDNATIVMTSNIGTHLFAQNRLGYGSEQSEQQVRRSDLLKEVKRFFQPEFLNRIDEIVFFQTLNLENVREIATMKLGSIFEQLKKQDKELRIQDEAMTELCKIGYDYEYGARNLERVLRRFLLDQLAEIALTDEWPSIRTIIAESRMGEIRLRGIGAAGMQELLHPQPAPEKQEFLEE